MEDNRLSHYNMGSIETDRNIFFIVMEQEFGIKKSDMEQVSSGYKFLFDSETNTYIRVAFSDNRCQVRTEFIGELAEDVVQVYQAFSKRFYNEKEEVE